MDKIYVERGQSQVIRGNKFFDGPLNGAPAFFGLPYTGRKLFSVNFPNGAETFLAPTNIRDNNYFKKFGLLTQNW